MNRRAKKLLAIAFSGILSTSALVMTAQAATSATVCCDNPILVDYTESSYGDPAPDYHTVWVEIGTKCKNCDKIEIHLVGKYFEEHDYDYYDLENHRRYCKCGDSFG